MSHSHSKTHIMAYYIIYQFTTFHGYPYRSITRPGPRPRDGSGRRARPGVSALGQAQDAVPRKSFDKQSCHRQTLYAPKEWLHMSGNNLPIVVKYPKPLNSNNKHEADKQSAILLRFIFAVTLLPDTGIVGF